MRSFFYSSGKKPTFCPSHHSWHHGMAIPGPAPDFLCIIKGPIFPRILILVVVSRPPRSAVRKKEKKIFLLSIDFVIFTKFRCRVFPAHPQILYKLFLLAGPLNRTALDFLIRPSPQTRRHRPKVHGCTLYLPNILHSTLGRYIAGRQAALRRYLSTYGIRTLSCTLYICTCTQTCT